MRIINAKSTLFRESELLMSPGSVAVGPVPKVKSNICERLGLLGNHEFF